MLSHAPCSFRDWSRSQPLADGLARAEADVRARPGDAASRWLLFELLCLLGHWERAQMQLRAWTRLIPQQEATARAAECLIRNELEREAVLAGRAQAVGLDAGGAPSPWMLQMVQALQLAAKGGDLSVPGPGSDDMRRDALAQAPDSPGRCNALEAPFAWITDADTRLGPMCEVYLAGRYHWLGMHQIHSLRKPAPFRLLDLVWSPAMLQLRDGRTLNAYLPVRYPVQPGSDDALLLSRKTVWTDRSDTCVEGQGQKTWSTDQGDIPLLDLRECTFATGAPAGRHEESAA